MKILVTGGAGFIGSHLMRYLTERGDEAVALDNLSVGSRKNLPEGVELITADVLSPEFGEIVAKGKYEAIVHLAGQTMVNRSIDDPPFDTKENVVGTVNVLEAARRANVRRVIFASSAAIYGNVSEEELPVKETKKPLPTSFYGLSKLTAEKYFELYQRVFGLDYVILRFANVYGERQGEGGEGGVISIFAQNIVKGEGITIFGDGEQTRDFIYAGDVASAIGAALLSEEVNAAYNVSTQTETSLRELVSILSNIAGHRIIPQYAPERPGDIYKSMLSNGRAKLGLNWKPKITLEEGLKMTYNYFAGEAVQA